MASSLPSFCSLNKPLIKHKVLKYTFPQVRFQSFHDEGKSADNVDANLSVLRERIEEVRKKERLNSTSCRLKNGWNYQSGYYHKHKSHAIISEFIELAGLVSGALGAVFLSGSLCIFFISLLVHFSK